MRPDFLIFLKIFDLKDMCICVWIYAFVSADAHDVQKRASDPLDLELQVLLSCHSWMLGTELIS